MNEDRKVAVRYISVTLVLSWVTQIAFSAIGNSPTFGMGMAMFVPAIVALLFIKFHHKKHLSDYGLGKKVGLGGARSILFAALFPMLFVGVLIVIGLIFDMVSLIPERVSKLAMFVFIPILGLIGSTGEEFGWREIGRAHV